MLTAASPRRCRRTRVAKVSVEPRYIRVPRRLPDHIVVPCAAKHLLSIANEHAVHRRSIGQLLDRDRAFRTEKNAHELVSRVSVAGTENISLSAESTSSRDGKRLTGAHIRAARALLRLTGEQFAQAAGVGLMSVRRAEATDGIVRVEADVERRLTAALDHLGVEVLFATRKSGLGVRLRSSSASAGAKTSSEMS